VSDERHRVTGTKVGTGTLDADDQTHHDKVHPVGTSVGGASGAVAGAVIGTAVGGPGIGTLVGAAVGAVASGMAGHGIAEGIDPTVEDSYWRENYKTRPYVNVKGNTSYDQYQPAYKYGWEARGQNPNRTWDQAENDLARGWEKAKGTSRQTWDEAKYAIKDAWTRVERALPAKYDNRETPPTGYTGTTAATSGSYAGIGSRSDLGPRTAHREDSVTSTVDPASLDDYRSAYWYGWDAVQEYPGRQWAEVAGELERNWDRARGTSRLSWRDAERAVHEAWDKAYSLQALPKASSSPKVTLQELHDPETGRLDAVRMADYLSLPLKQLSESLGRNYSTVHRTPTAPSIQETLRSIKRSLEILEEVLGDKASVLAWWNSPHPDLGRKTPMQVLLEGRAQAIEDMLEASLEGIPS
jgi:Glycine zipper/Protein of unknown function (DUF2384)